MSSISMSVQCIGPICRDCPDLDISITHLTGGGGSFQTNLLACTYYEQCSRIKEYVEKEKEKSSNE